MDESRRNFLKIAGCGALGAAWSLPILRATADAFKTKPMANALSAKQWGMVVDIKKCELPGVIEACIEACHKEHNVPHIPNPEEEVKWMWTEGFENAFPNQYHKHLSESVKESKVPVLCNHCENPPCVRVCPTQATYKSKDGIVVMDMHRCVGCRYCIAACPYGSRSFNWADPRKYLEGKLTNYPTRTKGVVEKCNFCAERLAQGRTPACVEAANRAPGGNGALIFGDVADPESEISRLLRTKPSIQRKPNLGTGPNIYYVL